MSPSDDVKLEVGKWLGRREAFGTIAGRCSAAAAESLRRVRDERLYREIEPTWEEFCRKHVGVSKRHVDRTLRLLEEFGPAYFHVAQLAHVTPDEYRAIAAHVGEDGVRVDGEVVALLPENSERVSTAVAELIRRERPEKAKAAGSATDAVAKRCAAAADAVEAMEGPVAPADVFAIGRHILRLFLAARQRGMWLAP